MLPVTSASRLCRGRWHEPYRGAGASRGPERRRGREGRVCATHRCQKKAIPPLKYLLTQPRGQSHRWELPASSSSESRPEVQRSWLSPADPGVAQRSGRCPRRLPQAEVQVPSSGTWGPAGHAEPPRAARRSPAQRPCARCLGAAIPSSRQSRPLPPFPPLCISLPICMHLLFPDVLYPLFPCPHMFPLHPSRSGPSPLRLSHHTVQQTSRAGDNKASEGLVSSQAHKAGRWLCNGATSPVQTPECFCFHFHTCSLVTSPRWVLLPPQQWSCKENLPQSPVCLTSSSSRMASVGPCH